MMVVEVACTLFYNWLYCISLCRNEQPWAVVISVQLGLSYIEKYFGTEKDYVFSNVPRENVILIACMTAIYFLLYANPLAWQTTTAIILGIN